MTTAILKGTWVGGETAVLVQNEQSARVGGSRFLTALGQMQMIANVLYLGEAAMKAASPAADPVIPWYVRRVLFLTPVITNTLCSRLSLEKNPYLKRTALYINDSIASLSELAIAVTSIALIALGERFYGFTTLAFMIHGFVQRHYWLPQWLSRGISDVGFCGRHIASFCFGNGFSKFSTILSIADFVYCRILPKQKASQLVDHEKSDLQITHIPTGKLVNIDPRHLKKRNIVPSAPDISIETLQEIFDAIDLQKEEYLKILRKIVTEDDHWKERYSDHKTDQELIDYVKTGLKTFIKDVSNETIKTGNIADYTSLQARAKHIAFKLPSQKKEDQWIHLLHLALAAYYCPAGYIREVRDVYYTVCSAAEEGSLRSKVLTILNNSRRYLFDIYYLNFSGNRYVPFFLDTHAYNEWIETLGESFGLAEVEDALEDNLGNVNYLIKKINNLLHHRQVRQFLEDYDARYVFQSIHMAIKDRQISNLQLEKWFVEEYTTAIKHERPQQENEKEGDYSIRLIKEGQAWVRENVYDEMDGTIKTEYLLFLLVKMQVLKYA